MTDVALWAMLIVVAYLAGSIPFGLLIARARGIDIRQHGSGNIGATNVYRIVGKREGKMCFALDFLKGFAPTLAAGLVMGVAGGGEVSRLTSWLWLLVAAASVLGHMYPVWLRFKGGKGVATGFGAMLGVWPMLTLPATLALATWIGCLYITSFVGFSSCAAAVSLPIWALLGALIGPRLSEDLPGWRQAGPYALVCLAMAFFVVIRHRGNLAKMMRHEEKRIGWGLQLGFGSGKDAAEGAKDAAPENEDRS